MHYASDAPILNVMHAIENRAVDATLNTNM